MTEDIISSLCLGEVFRMKFCTLGHASCSIRKHAKKVAVTLNHIYITGPCNQAFADAHLDPSHLTSQQHWELLREQHTLLEWQQLFGTLQGQDNALEEAAYCVVKERTFAQLMGGITPRKCKKRYMEDSDDDFPLGDMMEEDDPLTHVMAQIDQVLAMMKNISK